MDPPAPLHSLQTGVSFWTIQSDGFTIGTSMSAEKARQNKRLAFGCTYRLMDFSLDRHTFENVLVYVGWHVHWSV